MFVSDPVLRLAWTLPQALPWSRAARKPIVVLYHGVSSATGSSMSATVFEQHILFLKKHFDFAYPGEIESARPGRPRVLLTFDDGFRNNAQVVAPILRKHQVPAIFFICSRHAVDGKYLWFAHLMALENSFRWKEIAFRGTCYSMSAEARRATVERLRKELLALLPHPAALYQALETELPPLEDFVSQDERAALYSGMTAAHVGELAADPLFTVGVHTEDHPFLSRCGTTEARRQIERNAHWLQRATGQRCEFVAYPSGDYNTAVMKLCDDLGFTRGFAVTARAGAASRLAQPRLGIYSASTDVLGFKVQWGHLVRQAGLPIG